MEGRKDPGGSADSFNRVITPPRAWSGGERDRARRVNLVIINPDSKHKSYMAWAEWTPGSALSENESASLISQYTDSLM